MDVSTKLKELRKKAGLTQQEVADKVDVSRVAVGQWELGSVYAGAFDEDAGVRRRRGQRAIRGQGALAARPGRARPGHLHEQGDTGRPLVPGRPR